MTDAGESTGTKTCPRCAEEIKAEALVCHFCGQEFALLRRGYCSRCHRQVEIREGSTCPTCGSEVVDLIVESQPSPPPAPAAPTATPVPPPPAPPPPVAAPTDAAPSDQPPKRHLVRRISIALIATLALLFALLTLVFGPKDDDGGGGVNQAVIDAHAAICVPSSAIATDRAFLAQQTDPALARTAAAKMVSEAGMIATALEDAPDDIDPGIRSAAATVASSATADVADTAAITALGSANEALRTACDAQGF